MSHEAVEKAKEKFAVLVEEQLRRVEAMKKQTDVTDYSKLKQVVIGVCFGDGIGEIISRHSQKVLMHVLQNDVKSGKVVFKEIAGLTIENRVKHMKAIPEDVLAELKSCHVILKGPTTTPQAGDKWPNIESANVAMRRELDLFANVRPVRIPKEGVDWCFFRENTEGAYIVGSKGVSVTPDLSIDFTVTTEQGSERIVRMAFDYARKNKLNRVTAVTKSNVVKTTDGHFSKVFYRIAKEYPEMKVDEWYIDIMTAKLIDPERRREFQVLVMPNLYGDILTDEAAQLQGGVGTAGSANIGRRWSMFEAIHGSAPRMVQEGRAQYADPSSMIRASSMLLRHIGHPAEAEKVEMALEVCGQYEKKKVITGRDTGVAGDAYTDYILSWIDNPKLKERWEKESLPAAK